MTDFSASTISTNGNKAKQKQTHEQMQYTRVNA
jgi:hypothetical protein